MYPNPDWPESPSPEAIGFSSDGLNQYLNWLHAQASAEAYGTLIIRHGQIACETYESGGQPSSRWEIGSIRKSVTSVLLGMAIEENRIALNTEVHTVWPEIHTITGREKDRRIQMHHLATNASGWMTDHAPGESWLYNNAACTAGGSVLGRIYDLPGDRIAPLVAERIAAPIGAASWDCYHFEEPFTPSSHGNPGPKLAIDSTLRDLARFGYPWLHGGTWNNTPLVSKSYTREAVTNQVAPLNGHYGYWWFTNDAQILLPDAPPDTYYHIGNGRNDRRTVLIVIPSLDLIAIVGTSARAYDINKNYKAQPVPEVNDWISPILEAVIST